MTALRVLVVDDNELNAELARAVLEADGIECALAADAQAALRQMREFAPALVLMDIQLPGMDGLSLTRLIKAELAWRETVVVAFTAFATQVDEAHMLAAGCDGYLSKPIDVDRFAAQVRGLATRGPQR